MVALAVSQSLATLEWLGGHFSPATLFATSEPGVWFDPSDVANTNWLYNLLTWTEQFDNAAWIKNALSVSANSIVAPDGTTTADTLIETATNDLHVAYQAISLTALTAYTITSYLRAGARNFAMLRVGGGGFPTGPAIKASLTGAGSVSTIEGPVTSSSITSVGSGWYRVSMSFTSTATAAGYTPQFGPHDNGSSTIYTGNGTGSVYAWGAQLQTGSTATTYQPITTVAAETIARYPLATLYQDIAGTTPVTAPNQPVGMMLSKDKGLVLGPEIVTNGNNETALYSGAGAINGTLVRGAAPGGGFAAVFTCNAGFLSHQALYQTIAANTPVQISVRMYVPTGSLTTAQLFDATDGSWSGASTTVKDNWVTLTSIRNAKATSWTLGMGQIAGQSIGGQVFYVDDLSIKALPGNHATQSTSGSRPTYGIVPATGRRNLLTFTEQFDNAIWTLDNSGATNPIVTANFGTAPNGTQTADRIQLNKTGGTYSRIQQALSGLPSGIYTLSVWMRNNVAGTANVGIRIDAIGINCAVTTTWQRFSVTLAVAGTAASAQILLFDSIAGNDETADILAWGAQVELGSTATAYQKVVSAFEVTEANVASLSYIFFDGIDDFMLTPTITPGTDKVQVFAGVRKLSDATTGMVIEASTALSSNLGAFFLAAPNGAASNYSFVSKGSIPTFGSDGLANGFAAPTTNVVTGLGDISGNSVIIRVNATQRAIATTVQGTGNYLAYPMYIGRRGGTTLPFNGQMYGLITRFGANLNTSQLVSTEGWLNTKTGAY